MDLAPSFVDLLQAVAVVMHAPTQTTFIQIAGGWLFSHKRTVTRMIQCSGAMQDRHFCTFHRFFSAAVWSLDAMGIAVFCLLEPLFPKGPVFMVVDDTLARKRGRKIFGAGWHHDPMLKDAKAKTSWGHSWVVLGVVLRFDALPDRTAPMAMLFYSLVLLWFATKGHRQYKLATMPWHTQKQQPSFADMLVALRQESIKSHLKSLALPLVERQKIIRILENIAALAA